MRYFKRMFLVVIICALSCLPVKAEMTIEKLFFDKDELVQVLILTKIDPLPKNFIIQNIPKNTKVITVEEGTERGTIGNNIISLIAKNNLNNTFFSLSTHDIIIPSVKSLEYEVLPNVDKLMNIF